MNERPNTEQIKAELAADIMRLIGEQKLTDEEACARLAIGPADLARLRNDASRFSIEQLVGFVQAFDRTVKMTIRPTGNPLRRIVDPRYYGNDRGAMSQAIRSFVDRGCRFLVFGRSLAAEFHCLRHLDLPDELRAACIEVPPDVYREDVSSTALRGGK